MDEQQYTTQELGALLQAVGQLMQDNGLSIGAALDGQDAEYIAETMVELLGCGEDRAKQLAAITHEQFIRALGAI